MCARENLLKKAAKRRLSAYVICAIGTDASGSTYSQNELTDSAEDTAMSHVDRLSAMQAFVHVVKAGSFTKASDTLGVPKASVTRMIQGLELHLSTTLLHRSTRRVSVTPEGATYFEHALRIMQALDQVEGAMIEARTRPHGRLRVAMSSPVAQFAIPALPDFHHRYPEVQMELSVIDRQFDLAGEGIECALCTGEVTDQTLVARKIGQLEWVTCATSEYIERYGLPAHPSELETPQHHVLLQSCARSGRKLPLLFYRMGECVEVSTQNHIAVSEGFAHLEAGLSHVGVFQALRVMVARHLKSGHLVPILTDWQRDRLAAYAVYPPTKHLSAKTRVFIDWSAELMPKLNGHAVGAAQTPTTSQQVSYRRTVLSDRQPALAA